MMFGTTRTKAIQQMPTQHQPLRRGNRPRGMFGSRRAPVSMTPPIDDGQTPVGAQPPAQEVLPPASDDMPMPALRSGMNPHNVGWNGQPLPEGQIALSDTGTQPLQSALQQGPLGQSMREPFDYDAAMTALAGNQKKPSTFQTIAAILGDTASQLSGQQPFAVDRLNGRRAAQRNRMSDATRQLTEWRYKDHERQGEADLRAASPFSSGRDRVQFDPSTGQSRVIYDGIEDYEDYAATLGLEPGTQEYFDAVEDYVLRSSGPSAHDRDVVYDDHRTGNDERLEGVRYGNRVSLEDQRQTNRQSMEGRRQTNRETLRRMPPFRRGSRAGGTQEDIPVISSPAAARLLPSGTRFKTPDGKVKVVP